MHILSGEESEYVKFKCLMISRPRTQPPTAAAPTINQALSPEHKDILNVFNGLLATLDNLKLKPHEKKKITDDHARTQDLQQQCPLLSLSYWLRSPRLCTLAILTVPRKCIQQLLVITGMVTRCGCLD
jgi:hypothetical protein